MSGKCRSQRAICTQQRPGPARAGAGLVQQPLERSRSIRPETELVPPAGEIGLDRVHLETPATRGRRESSTPASPSHRRASGMRRTTGCAVRRRRPSPLRRPWSHAPGRSAAGGYLSSGASSTTRTMVAGAGSPGVICRSIPSYSVEPSRTSASVIRPRASSSQ